MIRIRIISKIRGKIFELEVPEDIPIFKMDEKFCKTSGYPMRQHLQYLYDGEVLDYDRDLSDYGIKDRDIIRVIDRNDIRGGGGEGDGSHICPYGCGRQIPNGYKGCTELLQAIPNYFG
jgi:hypothetical protein